MCVCIRVFCMCVNVRIFSILETPTLCKTLLLHFERCHFVRSRLS